VSVTPRRYRSNCFAANTRRTRGARGAVFGIAVAAETPVAGALPSKAIRSHFQLCLETHTVVAGLLGA